MTVVIVEEEGAVLVVNLGRPNAIHLTLISEVQGIEV